MTKDAIDEVRLFAPLIEMPSELGRARQRTKLEDAIAVESTASRQKRPSAPVDAPASIRPGHALRRRTYLVGAAAAMVAAAGVALPLSLGASTPPTGPVKRAAPVMKLAGYRLRLPSNYRLTTAKKATCHLPAGYPSGVTFAAPASSPPGGTASREQSPDYASQMAAAANGAGGCIWMALAPAYTPSSADPDPEAGALENARPVQVGPYEGRAGTWTFVAKPSNVASQEAWLYVEIPLAGGRTQDLVISAYNLSVGALVSIVADGLTVAGVSSS